jgi:hypothetical protein
VNDWMSYKHYHSSNACILQNRLILVESHPDVIGKLNNREKRNDGSVSGSVLVHDCTIIGTNNCGNNILLFFQCMHFAKQADTYLTPILW